MKNLVLLACLLVAIVVAYRSKEEDHKRKTEQQYRKMMKEIYAVCLEEVGFTEEEKTLAKEGLFEKIDETKRSCFAACAMKKQGQMEGSELKLDKIHEDIEEMHKYEPDKKEMAKAVTSKCHKEVSSIKNECEKAGNYVKCILKN